VAVWGASRRSSFIALVLVFGLVAPACTAPAPTPTPVVDPTLSPGPTATATDGTTASPTVLPTGTAALPQGSDRVTLNPADFRVGTNHDYWPMQPGSVWTYRETDAEGNVQRVVVEVTGDTRMISGIEAVVVHDQVTEEGELVEDTFDWYAQDRFGNLWYLGEDTKEYEGGEIVSTAGSWEHGVDGAMAGIILPADPRPGMSYRQEFYAGEAEDMAIVLSVEEVLVGHFGPDDVMLRDVVMTRDWTPLDPTVSEYKFYANGVGLVLVIGTSPELSIEELVSFAGPD
jgi:hypothetical protein